MIQNDKNKSEGHGFKPHQKQQTSLVMIDTRQSAQIQLSLIHM